MEENFNYPNNENIQLNIQVRKIESLKTEKSLEKKNTVQKNTVQKNGGPTEKKIDIQKLKSKDIQFEKLPIQKLIPVPFVDCVKSFSRIERCGQLIFIEFQMEKKWIDFLVHKIQNFESSSRNNVFSSVTNPNKINVDILVVDNSHLYSIYTNSYGFKLTLSNKHTSANIICDVHYMVENIEGRKVLIPQEKIKKGLLNYIIKKWSK